MSQQSKGYKMLGVNISSLLITIHSPLTLFLTLRSLLPIAFVICDPTTLPKQVKVLLLCWSFYNYDRHIYKYNMGESKVLGAAALGGVGKAVSGIMLEEILLANF
jgi:hypothetical protein